MKIWGVAGVLLAVGAVAAACAGHDRPAPASTPPTPSGTPTVQADSTPAAAPSAGSGRIPASVEVRGSGGQDVRYLDADGTAKTLRVQDFPRR